MRLFSLFALIACSFVCVAEQAVAEETKSAQHKNADKADSGKDPKKEGDKKSIHETLSVTKHTATIGGQKIAYTATAGRLTLLDDNEKDPTARMFFIAYTRDDGKPGNRPVTFCFNGGPGSCSVWLHLGMLGPKRVVLPDEPVFARPPARLVNNDFSLLDVTDLVFIDPVSTGFSRPEKPEDKSDFHGFHEDINSVGQFIHDYTTRFGRWGSPKYILGESYGGLRAAGLSGHLQDRYRIELNGAVIVSGVINFQTLRFTYGNDLPNIVFLPAYAATAWYHKALDDDLQSKSVAEVCEIAEKFAFGRYATALLAGDGLGKKKRAAIAKELSRLTGLSEEFVNASDLRISMQRFGKELLRDRDLVVGRFDSRYTGVSRTRAGETPDFDPSGAAVFGAFTGAMNQYLHDDLEVKEDRVYEILTGKVHPWSYDAFENRYVDASETLRQAMASNPWLKIFIAAGYYDLATPPTAMEYTISHLALTPERRENVTTRMYEGGHMMYVNLSALEQLRKDLLDFYSSSK